MALRLESGGNHFNWPNSIITGDTVRFAVSNGKLLVDLTFFRVYWDTLRRNLTRLVIGWLSDQVFDDSMVETNFNKIYCQRLYELIKTLPCEE